MERISSLHGFIYLVVIGVSLTISYLFFFNDLGIMFTNLSCS